MRLVDGRARVSSWEVTDVEEKEFKVEMNRSDMTLTLPLLIIES